VTKDKFWEIISASRSDFFKRPSTPNESGMIEGVMDHQVKHLREILVGLPLEEVANFNELFIEYMHEAYDWELWAAAFILGKGCSDDGFSDFRTWLISMGREIYENAIKNPESLVDVVDRKDVEDFFFEELGSVPIEVYEEQTGDWPRVSTGFKDEPKGIPFDEDDAALKNRLPLLFAKRNPIKKVP
jgi:hypothetical protein